MASEALIAAHKNDFNQSVLHEDAFYFSDLYDTQNLIQSVERRGKEEKMIANNFRKIKEQFSWDKVIDAYEQFICTCYNQSKQWTHSLP